jgi:hypothetical protein
MASVIGQVNENRGNISMTWHFVSNNVLFVHRLKVMKLSAQILFLF